MPIYFRLNYCILDKSLSLLLLNLPSQVFDKPDCQPWYMKVVISFDIKEPIGLRCWALNFQKLHHVPCAKDKAEEKKCRSEKIKGITRYL